MYCEQDNLYYTVLLDLDKILKRETGSKMNEKDEIIIRKIRQRGDKNNGSMLHLEQPDLALLG